MEPLLDCWCWATTVEADEGADSCGDAGAGEALPLLTGEEGVGVEEGKDGLL